MKNTTVLFLFFLLFSCTPIEDERVNIPDNVLPQEKMAEVLVDVHLLEATLNIGTYSKDQVVLNNINPGSDILKNNNITKQQFDQSFEFYSSNPNLLAEVYQMVLNELSKMQAEVMNGK